MQSRKAIAITMPFIPVDWLASESNRMYEVSGSNVCTKNLLHLNTLLSLHGVAI
jgi:hypothetical protein